jgi:hypothetical protein
MATAKQRMLDLSSLASGALARNHFLSIVQGESGDPYIVSVLEDISVDTNESEIEIEVSPVITIDVIVNKGGVDTYLDIKDINIQDSNNSIDVDKC